MSQKYYCEKKCCLIEVSNLVDNLFHRLKRASCKAGVLIYDPDQQRVLLVQSRGQLWGPPKGTVEISKNETSCQCAIREVKEETGLDIAPQDLTRAITIKNRAVYYYAEIKFTPVTIQTGQEDNDANGITWIKIDCLEQMIKSGQIILNQHCKIAFKKFLKLDFPKSDFIKVKSRRKK